MKVLLVLGVLGALAAGSPAAAVPPDPIGTVRTLATVPGTALDPLIVGQDCERRLVCLYDGTGAPLTRYGSRTDFFQQLDQLLRPAVYVRNNRTAEAAYFRHASGRVSCAEPGRTARFPAGDPVLGVLIGTTARCTFIFD